MCGIAGIFFKDKALEAELGNLLAGMLTALSDRGPDSTGFAIYGSGIPARIKLTLRLPNGFDVDALIPRSSAAAATRLAPVMHESHMVLSVPVDSEPAVRAEIARHPGVSIVSTGRRMEVFKDVGRPEKVAVRFGLERMTGTHAVGHTRMATESAVTTNGAHPFTTGPDQCLVHNGSLSNHNALRRQLMRDGLTFETDNDSEVAAGLLTWKMREGASLQQAMDAALDALDGFYTFVIGTESGFGVLRDPIACKPAVMAETDSWVAFGTEYRALAGLPGVERAKVWEPAPARVYFWERPH
jgi:glutamate synthase domain-containing protein 1